jgi:Family of unknown function (DUF6178)
MISLSRGIALDPDDPVHALLSLKEADALRAAVNALDDDEAALLLVRAPDLEDKSRLVWALAPNRRAEVLDRLHPGFVGALIQNREAENKRLLGDLSREQFTHLLRFCSPAQAYYWLTLATSFEDARANVLPLLIPLGDLAAALMTSTEFETHCQAIGSFGDEDLRVELESFAHHGEATLTVIWGDGRIEEFSMSDVSIEDVREFLEEFEDFAAARLTVPGLDGKMQELPISRDGIEDLRFDLGDFKDIALAVVTMYGADGMLKQFPIRDSGLRKLLQTILDYDLEQYAALIHAALHLSDYRQNHPEEDEVVGQDAILLNDLLTVEEERSRVGLAQGEAAAEAQDATPEGGSSARPAPGSASSIPDLPVRRSGALMQAAVQTLPAPRQAELSQEIQLLFMQEAAYAGGSFAQADLEHAASRVQLYIQLGLAGLADGDPEQAARLLGEQRLRTLMESGARHVERMRQVALRLLPWQEVLDSRQLALLQSLEHPDVRLDEVSAQPMLRLRRTQGGPKAPAEPLSLALEAVPAALEEISAWVMLVRTVGKDRIARQMPGTAPAALTRALVAAALLYRRWDPELVEPADLDRCRETYRDPATGRFNAAAFQSLAEALRALAAARKLDARAVEQVARLLARAMDQLAAATG